MNAVGIEGIIPINLAYDKSVCLAVESEVRKKFIVGRVRCVKFLSGAGRCSEG